MKNAKKWTKVEINDFNQYNCSPEKVCLYEVEFFWRLLSQILRYTISKCIFTKQDVLKNGKCHEIGQKLKYMTSINMVALQKKFSYMRWSSFGSLLSQILKYTFSKRIFTIQDVLKMENTMESAKN